MRQGLLQGAHAQVRAHSAFLEKDRYLAPEIEALQDCVHEGALLHGTPIGEMAATLFRA